MSAKSVLTIAQLASADRAAIAAGTPALELVRRAGAAVADLICERFSARPAAVLCGPGDNGGDGYVVARLLAERGWSVWVERADLPQSEAAKAMAAEWSGDVLELGEGGRTAELIVDALFGAGLGRPLEGAYAKAARATERRADQVVAIDLPSGLHGDTGKTLGEASVWAGLTVTFHAKKPGHLLEPGQSRCGEVVVADIGLDPVETDLFENTPEAWQGHFPWPTAASHKHARGRLMVVSGEAWNTGAARLAARAGLRMGAGLVTLLSPPDALTVNAAHLEAVMLRPFQTEFELEAACADADAVIIGPAAGINDTTLLNTLALARTGAALVIDADAITVFREDPEELFSALDIDDVLTPHLGEFERLFPGLIKASPERIAAVRKAARTADAVVLLKGADTVIAHPDGRASVSSNGSPWLATAGSGDVLAGFIGALIAQGMESFEAACAGAWIHAEAAELHGPGLISEDLPVLATQVLARLYSER